MKKLITMVAAIFLTAGISAFASGTNDGTSPGKRINYQVSFSKIELSDDIDLVLHESQNKFIDVTGNTADIEKVNWKIKDGILFISSKKGSLKDKVKVIVSVNQLKKLEIYGESTVNSLGELSSKELHVSIEGDSYVALKNSGEIHITNSPNTQLEVKRIVGDVSVN
jgi:DUF4097 and DUF4098 domain-containing protein YvlB